MERYYLNYLKSMTDDPLVQKYVDMLKAELDWRFYADGQDLDNEYRWNGSLPFKMKLYYDIERTISLFSRKEVGNSQILTSFRFPCALDSYKFYSSIAHPVGIKNVLGGLATWRKARCVDKIVHMYPYNQLLSGSVIDCLEEYETHLDKLYFEKNDIKALFLFTDQYFWTKLDIEIFKKRNRPSFIFIHGLPGYYSPDIDNKSDYIIVWGDKMKQNFVDAGYDADKIFAIGNFRYVNVKFHDRLRNTTDDVLVITTSTKIFHQDTWNSTPTISDPSATLLYLYQIENVLKRLGVKHVRLRPHPTVNRQWIKSIIDNDFFVLDTDNLTNSLNRSTLVVGPTSTVSLEAIMNGVNYIVFEPCDDKGYNFVNRPLAPPFDGSDCNLCVANDEDVFYAMIKEKQCSSSNLLREYMQPFEPNVLKGLIEK